MSTLANVVSFHADATGTMSAGPYNLAGYQVAPGGTAGEITFRDGGASGTVRMIVHITTNTAVIATIIPGTGIRFYNDIHVTLPASSSVTIFCG
jgi:hypothetical protein